MDTVVVHIQRICNIRLHLVLFGCVDLDGYSCHHIVVCKIKSNDFLNTMLTGLPKCFTDLSVKTIASQVAGAEAFSTVFLSPNLVLIRYAII